MPDYPRPPDEIGLEITKLPNGRWAVVEPLMFGEARLCLVDEWHHLTYETEWHYRSMEEARIALRRWEGEGQPVGWFRHR